MRYDLFKKLLEKYNGTIGEFKKALLKDEDKLTVGQAIELLKRTKIENKEEFNKIEFPQEYSKNPYFMNKAIEFELDHQKCNDIQNNEDAVNVCKRLSTKFYFLYKKEQQKTVKNLLENYETHYFRYRDLSPTVKNSVEFAKKHFLKKPRDIVYAGPDVISNKEIAKIVIEREGCLICFFSKEIREDEKFQELAIKNDYFALPFVNEKYRNDKEFITKAVEKDPIFFKFASDSLKKDKNFVFNLISKGHGLVYYFIDESLKSRELLEYSLSKDGNLIALLGNGARSSPNLASIAIKNKPYAVNYVKDFIDLKNFENLLLEIVQSDYHFLKYYPVKKNEALAYKIVQINGLALEYLSNYFYLGKDFILKAVEQNGQAILFAPPILQKDWDIISASVKQDPYNIFLLDESIRKDKSLIKFLNLDIDSLLSNYFVTPNIENKDDEKYHEEPESFLNSDESDSSNVDLKKDDGISSEDYLNILKEDGLKLKTLDESCKDNKELVLAAIKQNCRAYEFVGERLKFDKDVVFAYIDNRGFSLYEPEKDYVSALVKEIASQPELFKRVIYVEPNNLGVICDCLRINGLLLKCFSNDDLYYMIKAEHAIKQNPNAILYILEKYKSNHFFGNIAIKGDYKITEKIISNYKGKEGKLIESFKYWIEQDHNYYNYFNRFIDMSLFWHDVLKCNPKVYEILSDDIKSNINAIKLGIIAYPDAVKNYTYFENAFDLYNVRQFIEINPRSIEFIRDDYKYNYNVYSEALRLDGLVVSYLTRIMDKLNFFNIVEAIENNAEAYPIFDSYFKFTYEEDKLLIKKNPLILQYLDSSYVENKEEAIEYVKINGMALEYIPEDLRIEEEVYSEALKNNGAAIKFIKDDLDEIKNKYIEDALISNPSSYEIFSEYFDVEDNVENVVLKNPLILNYVSDELAEKIIITDYYKDDYGGDKPIFNKNFVIRILKGNEKFYHNSIFKKTVFSINWDQTLKDEGIDIDCLFYEPLDIFAVIYHTDIFSNPSSFLDLDREDMIKVLSLNGLLLKHLSDELRDDDEICEVSLKQNGLALQYCSDRIKKNVELASIAVKQNPVAFKYCNIVIQFEGQIIHSALNMDVNILRYVYLFKDELHFPFKGIFEKDPTCVKYFMDILDLIDEEAINVLNKNPEIKYYINWRK